ncbi:MAG: type II toxin-antitoxin system VapC family toxin [Rhodospirillales bacterium]|nr:type II toxin-antitoxin system VapC family toxin [Rhodospirillales bacterium]
MKYLLDTNVLSELRKGGRCHPQLAQWIKSLPSKDFATSVLVLGEIRKGIELKRRKDPTQAAVIERWLEQVRMTFADRILGIDERIAEEWGRLSVPDPVSVIDGLLAATAKVYGLTLATRNIKDIAKTGVLVIDPFAD